MPNVNASEIGRKNAHVSGRQIVAARALLDWTRRRLSSESGVSVRTLARIEEEGNGGRSTMGAIIATLAKAGIDFTETGVALSSRQ